jgi:hypothetical protein
LVDDYVDALDDASRQLLPRCASAVKNSIKEVRAKTKCSDMQATMAVLASLFAANIQLQHRMKALEQKPTLKYRGIWSEGTFYEANALVTHGGSLWIAKSQSRGRTPGIRSEVEESAPWQLCAKRGKDGRDGRDGKDAR